MMDWRWLMIFLAQLGCGVWLIVTGGSEALTDLGMLLLGGALGQGTTGGLTLRRASSRSN